MSHPYSIVVDKGCSFAQAQAKLRAVCHLETEQSFSPHPDSPITLSIIWQQGRPDVRLWTGPANQSYPYVQKQNHIEIDLEDIASSYDIPAFKQTHIVSHWLPWYDGWKYMLHPPRFDKQTILLPACGFDQDCWYDGWLGFVDSSQNFQTLVPPGRMLQASFRLPFPHEGKDFAASFQMMPSYMEIARQCLCQSLRETIKRHSNGYKIEEFSLEEAVMINLIKQTFPLDSLNIKSDLPFKDWPRPWKVLQGSLAMNLLSSLPEAISLSDFRSLIKGFDTTEMALEINRKSRILSPFFAKERGERR
jgi:hypothetical protein